MRAVISMAQNCLLSIRVSSAVWCRNHFSYGHLGTMTITLTITLTSGEQFARWCLFSVKRSSHFSRHNLKDVIFWYCFSALCLCRLLSNIYFPLSRFLFWRGTNPFATVKLKPTHTDDRSAPRLYRRWHLNPETSASFELGGSFLTPEIAEYI